MLAVLYDIHGNLPALEAVVAAARGEGVTGWFLGGDYVGFGPFPRETLALLDELRPATWIRGNGERWLRELPVDRPEILDGVKLMREPWSEDELERLYRLPVRAELDGVVFVHGCWHTDVDSFAREEQPSDEVRAGGLVGRTLVFGHSHVQFRRPGPNGNLLVNPGSVGMPLDGDPRAAWAVWDGSDFAFRRTEYDVERVVAAARALGAWGERMIQRYEHASDESGRSSPAPAGS